jgi:flagellar biosynthesis protein FlhF
MDGLYDRLLSADVESDYARQLVDDYQKYKGGVPFEKWIASKIRCATLSNVPGGRRVMLLGPTGVGKTTTIAKLAAVQALWEHKNVLLLTSDTYRIAAVDQLRTYAKILGVPIEVIFEMENFASVLQEHADADLMLLDTAGRGQRDRRNLETLEVIYDIFKPDAVHLVLAANMKYKDMMDVVEKMSVVPISHIIFTKLDETVSYGALFSTLKSLDCPLSFFTTGQNVPNDIEVASGERLVELLMNDENRRNAL